jgi:hypothetical protein
MLLILQGLFSLIKFIFKIFVQAVTKILELFCLHFLAGYALFCLVIVLIFNIDVKDVSPQLQIVFFIGLGFTVYLTFKYLLDRSRGGNDAPPRYKKYRNRPVAYNDDYYKNRYEFNYPEDDYYDRRAAYPVYDERSRYTAYNNYPAYEDYHAQNKQKYYKDVPKIPAKNYYENYNIKPSLDYREDEEAAGAESLFSYMKNAKAMTTAYKDNSVKPVVLRNKINKSIVLHQYPNYVEVYKELPNGELVLIKVEEI